MGLSVRLTPIDVSDFALSLVVVRSWFEELTRLVPTP